MTKLRGKSLMPLEAYIDIDHSVYLPNLIKPMKDYIIYNHDPKTIDVEKAVVSDKEIVCKVTTAEEIVDILDFISRLDGELKFSLQVYYSSLSNKDFEAWHTVKMEESAKKPNIWKAPSAGFI